MPSMSTHQVGVLRTWTLFNDDMEIFRIIMGYLKPTFAVAAFPWLNL
jgi:hypothetical protein